MQLEDLTTAVTRRELIAGGHTPDEIRRAVASGAVVRLIRGVFAPPSIDDLTPEARHAQLALAIARDRDGALAWTSAAAVHGLPIWGLSEDQIHLSSERGASGTRGSGSVVVHGDRRPSAIVDVGGVRVVSAARTVVDLARTQDRVAAVAIGDAALHARLCTRQELLDELALASGYRGHARATRVVALLDEASESVLESRSRVLIIDDPDLPNPETQIDVYDAYGHFLARSDLLWRDEKLIGECDGEGKYRGKFGVQPEVAVIREKERTDRLHEAGWRVVRWGWRDMRHPDRVLSRIKRMMRSAAA